MNFAPIVLFVYNRPVHTAQVLEALSLCEHADKTILYIYSDGPKPGTDEVTKQNIRAVRELIRQRKWCKEVFLVEQEVNLGLAGSVINGVSEVIRQHGKIIVLEDDLVVAPGFLQYMNEALNLYQEDERVGCIHAWNYHFKTNPTNQSTFFLKGGDCWGWATWKRAWDLFEPDGRKLLNQLEEKNLAYAFDRNGTYPFTEMLRLQIEGKNNSWAIRWHASLFLLNKFCLQPFDPIVKNIGLDNSGVHCEAVDMIQHTVDTIHLESIPVEEAGWFFDAYNEYVKNNEMNAGRKPESFFSKFKRIFKDKILSR